MEERTPQKGTVQAWPCLKLREQSQLECLPSRTLELPCGLLRLLCGPAHVERTLWAYKDVQTDDSHPLEKNGRHALQSAQVGEDSS